MYLIAAFISDDTIARHGLSTALVVAILTWFFVGFVPWIMRKYEERLDKQEKRHADTEKARSAIFQSSLAQILDHSKSMHASNMREISKLNGEVKQIGDEVHALRHDVNQYMDIGVRARLATASAGVPSIMDTTDAMNEPAFSVPAKPTRTLSYGDK